MTRKLKNKFGYKLNDSVVTIQKKGANMKAIFKSGFEIEYKKGQENRIEWLLDQIDNKGLN